MTIINEMAEIKWLMKSNENDNEICNNVIIFIWQWKILLLSIK